MKKLKLKSGDIVKTASGKRYMVMKDCQTELYGFQDFVFVSPNGFLIGSDYDENLNFLGNNKDYDLTFVMSTNIDGSFFPRIAIYLN